MQITTEELSIRLDAAETHYAESFTSSHNLVSLAAQWVLIKELRDQLSKIQEEEDARLPPFTDS